MEEKTPKGESSFHLGALVAESSDKEVIQRSLKVLSGAFIAVECAILIMMFCFFSYYFSGNSSVFNKPMTAIIFIVSAIGLGVGLKVLLRSINIGWLSVYENGLSPTMPNLYLGLNYTRKMIPWTEIDVAKEFHNKSRSRFVLLIGLKGPDDIAYSLQMGGEGSDEKSYGALKAKLNEMGVLEEKEETDKRLGEMVKRPPLFPILH